MRANSLYNGEAGGECTGERKQVFNAGLMALRTTGFADEGVAHDPSGHPKTHEKDRG